MCIESDLETYLKPITTFDALAFKSHIVNSNRMCFHTTFFGWVSLCIAVNIEWVHQLHPLLFMC